MHITFVKKILANGQPCPKCAEVEELMDRAGHMQHIDRVVIADERAPHSTGMVLAERHNVSVAPFFIVEDGDKTTVYTVYLRFAKEVLGNRANAVDEAQEMLRADPDLDLI